MSEHPQDPQQRAAQSGAGGYTSKTDDELNAFEIEEGAIGHDRGKKGAGGGPGGMMPPMMGGAGAGGAGAGGGAMGAGGLGLPGVGLGTGGTMPAGAAMGGVGRAGAGSFGGAGGSFGGGGGYGGGVGGGFGGTRAADGSSSDYSINPSTGLPWQPGDPGYPGGTNPGGSAPGGPGYPGYPPYRPGDPNYPGTPSRGPVTRISRRSIDRPIPRCRRDQTIRAIGPRPMTRRCRRGPATPVIGRRLIRWCPRGPVTPGIRSPGIPPGPRTQPFRPTVVASVSARWEQFASQLATLQVRAEELKALGWQGTAAENYRSQLPSFSADVDKLFGLTVAASAGTVAATGSRCRPRRLQSADR